MIRVFATALPLIFMLAFHFCCEAFTPITHNPTTTRTSKAITSTQLLVSQSSSNGNEKITAGDDHHHHDPSTFTSRRTSIEKMVHYATATAVAAGSTVLLCRPNIASAIEAQDFVQKYDDFTLTDEGWSYRDVSVGTGDVIAKDGDRIVFEWSGYTIGYFGRPFQAKGGPQGGAFDKDIDYSRTVIGSNKIVKGLECAMRNMKPGGVRQVIIPYGPLSYPETDMEHDIIGPKPTTFSGQRALNFVLENPRVDRTLLFNVKVIRIDKSDGKGGFIRG